jgi:hypothetical protein
MRPKDRKQQIGFSQRIRLEWLETVANLVLAGNDEKAIYEALQDLLKDKVSIGSNARWGNRGKTISILMKIWVRPPKYLKDFHQDALKLLKYLHSDEHLALHWGMAVAVYPFFGAVALQTGRLLRLQGTVSPAPVLRRLKEQYGERETVLRAARRILRSFIDWGVLRETEKKGVYIRGNVQNISKPELIAWMIEAYLHSQTNGNMELRSIIQSPIFFPFSFKAVQTILKTSLPRIELLTHAMDQQLVYLKTSPRRLIH